MAETPNPGRIQRVPQGLLQVLNMQNSGETPRELAASVAGIVDLLQFYGLTQLQRMSASDGALAEAGNISIQTPNAWCLLFGANARAVQTATQTALRLNILINRTPGAAAGTSIPVASGSPFAYGATFTGDFDVPWRAPYPLLMPPLSLIQANLSLLGTDATASVNILAEVGVLG